MKHCTVLPIKDQRLCVVVIPGYIPATPTFFTKVQHAVATAAASPIFGFDNGQVPAILVPIMHVCGTTLSMGGFTQPFAHFLVICDSGHI